MRYLLPPPTTPSLLMMTLSVFTLLLGPPNVPKSRKMKRFQNKLFFLIDLLLLSVVTYLSYVARFEGLLWAPEMRTGFVAFLLAVAVAIDELSPVGLVDRLRFTEIDQFQKLCDVRRRVVRYGGARGSRHETRHKSGQRGFGRVEAHALFQISRTLNLEAAGRPFKAERRQRHPSRLRMPRKSSTSW